MLDPKTLLQLFEGENIILTSPSKSSNSESFECLVDVASSDFAFILHSLSQEFETLQDILAKSRLENIASIYSLSNFTSQFSELPHTYLFYFSHEDDFASKYFFKSFRKEEKKIYILPPLSDIVSDDESKKMFWHRILKPLRPD